LRPVLLDTTRSAAGGTLDLQAAGVDAAPEFEIADFIDASAVFGAIAARLAGPTAVPAVEVFGVKQAADREIGVTVAAAFLGRAACPLRLGTCPVGELVGTRTALRSIIRAGTAAARIQWAAGE
jgi:hypothetical protein